MKWLSLACLTIAFKYRTVIIFNLLRFACVVIAKGQPTPEFKKTAVSRLPPHAASGRARCRAIVYLFFLGGGGVEFSLKRLFLAERTATKPLRMKRQIEFRAIPRVSVCFRLFPSVSVYFRLMFPGNIAVQHRDPCPNGSGAVQMQCCSACTPGCQRLRR